VDADECRDENECPACGCVLDREERGRVLCAKCGNDCPGCGVELHPVEVERGQVVCVLCDDQLERELAAYLTFVAVCRE
jgi:hypothetical protein